jgi:hypothetical protein
MFPGGPRYRPSDGLRNAAGVDAVDIMGVDDVYTMLLDYLFQRLGEPQ